MLVYEEAWDYKSYLDSDLLEYKEKQEMIFEKISLNQNNIKKIKGINKIVNLVIFAEIYCPDCRALIPFVEKIRNLNSHINISIFPRKGNEEFLIKHTGIARIPTVLMEDLKKGDEFFVPIFEEFPSNVREQLDLLEYPSEKEKLSYDYRTGKNNEEIEEFLVNKILELLD